MRYSTPIVLSLAVAAACLLPACGKAYMAAAEAFGYEKREMLTDRVEAARDQQMEAREQFESALDEFRALTGPIDEDLEELYDRLDKQLDRSRSKASGVRSRIAKVEEVADALFKEWREELDDYHTESLRASSEEQLEQTEQRYQQLIDAMKRAESRMQPVLDAFSDQVLFLKHNLNARAVAALKSEVGNIGGKVDRLIEDMNKAIAEADSFIQTMK